MSDDNKMLFLKNRDAAMSDEEALPMEYQIIADAHIVGEFTYDPYILRIWELSNKQPGEERFLCFKTRELPAHKDKSWESAKRTGYYHGGGIAAELVALTSLFLRRRLRLGPVVRFHDDPCMFPEDRRWINKQLIDGRSDLSDIEEDFKLTENLKPSNQQPFMFAARRYQQSLELIETRPDWAYLSLVSAIEVLAQNHELPTDANLDEWDPKLAKLTARIDDEKLRHKIEERVLEKKFSVRRFVDIISSHIHESFWAYSSRPERGRINPSDLPALLKKIYNQRSRTLHDGDPFPPYACGPPHFEGELPTGFAIIIGEKKWEASDYIPHVQFFERLVNHVILNYLKANQAEK